MEQTPLSEFKAFPKIPRLNRTVYVLEKIDGTNACVIVPEDAAAPLRAQSRTRFITPGNDNYGFAAWARDHEAELRTLGPGRHYGEFWGRGIQRNYGQTEPHFSLFNVSRWNRHIWLHNETVRAARESLRTHSSIVPDLFVPAPACCLVVPVLNVLDSFDLVGIMGCARNLCDNGSVAAPGFPNPEGIVVFHTASGALFKYTLDGDGHKG